MKDLDCLSAGCACYFYTTETTSALHPINQVLLTITLCLQIIDMSHGSDYAFADTY